MEEPVIDVEAPQGGAKQTAKDLFSGAVGGIAQVLIGKKHISLNDAKSAGFGNMAMVILQFLPSVVCNGLHC